LYYKRLRTGWSPDRNQVRYTGTQATIAMLTEPTSARRQAFELLGAAIPLTLK